MSETYNKNWASEIKSVDIKSDGIPDSKIGKVKEDKVRKAAIDMINSYWVRSLPAEQFNKYVEEMKDILKRKDIDEEKLKNEYENILNQEKEIIKLKETINSFESTFKSFYDTINSAGGTDVALDWLAGGIDKIAGTKFGGVGKSLKENFENSKKAFIDDYQKIKDSYEKNKDKLTEKQKEEYEKIIKKGDILTKLKIEDPSFAQMMKSQGKNTGDQMSNVAKTVKSAVIPNSKKKVSTKKEVKKISKNKTRLEFFLNELGIDIKEIEGKDEKELRKFFNSRKIDKNKQDYLIDLNLKNPKGNNIEYRPSFLSSEEILKVVDPKNKGKNTGQSNENQQNPNTSLPSNKKSENYNFTSTVVNVPSYNRERFFGEIFKNLDSGKGKNENLSFPNGFSVNISRDGNGYKINYGDKKEACRNIDEVINVLNMGEYIQKLGLGFLFGGINKIIYRINQKGDGKIDEKDGLSNKEMRLGLNSIGHALIPGFDSTKTEIKDLENQFTDKDIFNAKIDNAKTDKNSKFYDKLKGQIGNISSLEQLAKVLYSGNSKGKDFSIDSFINNL